MYSLNGQQRIFVKDTNAAQPESFVVSSTVTPWSRNMKLVEVMRNDDLGKSQARVATEGGEVLTINFAELPATPIATVANPLPLPPGTPGLVNPVGQPNQPAMPMTRPIRPRRGVPVQPGMPGQVPSVPTNRPTMPVNVPMGSVPQPGSFNSAFPTVSATEDALPRRYDPNRPDLPRRGDPIRVIQRSSIAAPTPSPDQ